METATLNFLASASPSTRFKQIGSTFKSFLEEKEARLRMNVCHVGTTGCVLVLTLWNQTSKQNKNSTPHPTPKTKMKQNNAAP